MAAQNWPTTFVNPPTTFIPGLVVNGEFQRTRGGIDLVNVVTMLHAAELNFDLRDFDHEARWQGMIAEMLAGSAFKMPWYGYPQKFGDATGTITVSGGHSAGDKSITVAGKSGTLRSGALVSMGDPPFLYRLTGQSTGSTLLIMPGLHLNVTGGSLVTYDPDPSSNSYLLATVSLDASAFVSGVDPLAEFTSIENWVSGITMRFVETVRTSY